VEITIPVEEGSIPILYYIDEAEKLNAMMLAGFDRVNGFAKFITFHASNFAPLLEFAVPINVPLFFTGFNPYDDGFQIGNDGSYWSPGGECAGMTAFARWNFLNGEHNLFGWCYEPLDVAVGTKYAQHNIVSRADASYRQAYCDSCNFSVHALNPEENMYVILNVMLNTNAPVDLTLGQDNSTTAHASLAYGFASLTTYGLTEIYVYDPNQPGITETITFDHSVPEFRPALPGGYPNISIYGLGSIPCFETMEDIVADCELVDRTLGEPDPFRLRRNCTIEILSHLSNECVNSDEILIEGIVESGAYRIEKLTIRIEYEDFTMGPESEIEIYDDGEFQATLELRSGKNDIYFEAEAWNYENELTWVIHTWEDMNENTGENQFVINNGDCYWVEVWPDVEDYVYLDQFTYDDASDLLVARGFFSECIDLNPDTVINEPNCPPNPDAGDYLHVFYTKGGVYSGYETFEYCATPCGGPFSYDSCKDDPENDSWAWAHGIFRDSWGDYYWNFRTAITDPETMQSALTRVYVKALTPTCGETVYSYSSSSDDGWERAFCGAYVNQHGDAYIGHSVLDQYFDWDLEEYVITVFNQGLSQVNLRSTQSEMNTPLNFSNRECLLGSYIGFDQHDNIYVPLSRQLLDYPCCTYEKQLKVYSPGGTQTCDVLLTPQDGSSSVGIYNRGAIPANANGDFVLHGSVNGLVNLAGYSSSGGDTDYIIVLDENGNPAWNVPLTGVSIDNDDWGNVWNGGEFYKEPVALDDDCNLYVYNDGELTKYEYPTGVIPDDWPKALDPNVNVRFMFTDSSGNLFLGGYFSGTVDFNFDPVSVDNRTAVGSRDPFIMMYNPG